MFSYPEQLFSVEKCFVFKLGYFSGQLEIISVKQIKIKNFSIVLIRNFLSLGDGKWRVPP